MYELKDINSLRSFITEILKLRDLVKCPICLEIVNNSVQIQCGHTYCADCLSMFQNINATTNVKCPFCWKPISRQKCSNHKVESLAKFVLSVSDKLKALLGCDVLDANSTDLINSKLNSLEENSSSNLNKASTSIISPTVYDESPKFTTNEEDIFDSHTEKRTPIRYKNIKTYHKEKKLKMKVLPCDKILSFEDDNNKMKIVKWLTDNGNYFDRISQTQQETVESQSPISFDMPSISQDSKKYMQNYNENLKNVRKNRADISEKSRYKRRACSLEIVIGSYPNKPVVQRHSLSCETPDFEDKNIEEIDSRSGIDDVVHLMEEDYLNILETDVALINRTSPKDKLCNRELKENKKKDEFMKENIENNSSNVKERSGWSRIKEIKKTISKNNRKPRKLHVNYTPASSNSKGKVEMSTKKSIKNRPVVLLEKLHLNNDNIAAVVPQEDFDENIVEAAGIKVIKPDVEERLISTTISTNDLDRTETVITDDTQKVETRDSNITKNVELPPSGSFKRQVLMPDSPATLVQLKKRVTLPNSIVNKYNNVTLDEKENDSAISKSVDINKDNLNINQQKSEILTSLGENFVCKSNTPVTTNHPSSGAVNISDDFFMQPTQAVVLSNVAKQTDIIEQKLEAMFSSPHKDNSVTSQIVQNNERLIDSLSDCNELIAKYINELLTNTNSTETSAELCCSRIQSLLKEIRQFSKDKAKVNCSISLPKTPDTVTSSSKKTMYSEHKNATVQTINLDVHSTGIQTDAVVSPGFRISSTASFKTQIRNCADTETQTDPFICSNCKLTTHVAAVDCSETRTPSEILVHDHKLIKRLSEKYVFTQSLDNIQFNTQDVVDDTIKETTKNNEHLVDVASEPVLQQPCQFELIKTQHHKPLHLTSKYEFTQSLDDIQLNTCEIIQNASKLNIQDCRKEIGFDNLGNRKTIEFPPAATGEIDKSTSEYQLGQSLDSINFNTHDIDQHTKIELHKNPSLESNLVCSVSIGSQNQKKQHVNRKLQFLEVSRRFKRIRAPSSDSDSDSENKKKIAKLENIHMRDDLSVHFITQSIAEDSNLNATKHNTLSLSVDGSENINYDEYLEKIMRKYDNTASSFKPTKPKDVAHQSVVDFERIMQPHIINKSICERNKEVDEPSLKIKQTENFSESMFSNDQASLVQNMQALRNNLQNSCNVVQICNNKNKSPPHSLVDEFKKHLEKDNTEIHTELMNEEVTVNTENNEKVTILQNIVIKPNDVTHLEYNLDEELDKMEVNEEIRSEKSDEIFTSESEDLDVVDTTPQKRSPPRLMSQSYQRMKNHLLLPALLDLPDVKDTPLSCLDLELPPPLEFQDANEDEQGNDITIANSFDLDETLVPAENNGDAIDNRPLPLLKENVSINTSLQKSITISPIKPERKILNPVALAHNSRFSPLDVVVKSQPKRRVITSTPKQKSILSYVRTSQPSDTPESVISIKSSQDEQVRDEKPCIACTRLTKDQVIAISALTNKKLATYSSSFNASVTHLIVSVNDRNCIKDHTIKFVSAVASGIWVLSFNWIQDCLSQNRIVEEELYEALDVSGIAGPRLARLTRLKKPLFKGFKIHVAPPFLSTTQKDIEDVITMLGGQVVPRPDCLIDNNGIRVIITEAKATQDFEIYETWLETLNVVTVDIEWVSRSVGQYQLLSLRPFALCSEDTICDLGYPPELLVNAPFSFSQSIYST